jgi:hypothetical protein
MPHAPLQPQADTVHLTYQTNPIEHPLANHNRIKDLKFSPTPIAFPVAVSDLNLYHF